MLTGACDSWPLDGPYDPTRCTPRCQDWEECYEGECVPLKKDVGINVDLDARPDLDAKIDVTNDIDQPPDIKKLPDVKLPDAHVPSCSDGIKNGNETDVDCGGSCKTCDLGKGCKNGTDCSTGYCDSTCRPVIVSFTLVDATTDKIVPQHNPIQNGATIDLTGIGYVNIIANANPPVVGCVDMFHNGILERTEAGSPYTLMGDVVHDSGMPDYVGTWQPTGQHTIEAVPYMGCVFNPPANPTKTDKGKSLKITVTFQ